MHRESSSNVYGQANAKVYASNINKNIDEGMLKKKFEEFGFVRSCILKKKPNDVTYSFIEFVRDEDAAAAIQALNGKVMWDRILKVEGGKGGKKGFHHYLTDEERDMRFGENRRNTYHGDQNQSRFEPSQNKERIYSPRYNSKQLYQRTANEFYWPREKRDSYGRSLERSQKTIRERHKRSEKRKYSNVSSEEYRRQKQSKLPRRTDYRREDSPKGDNQVKKCYYQPYEAERHHQRVRQKQRQRTRIQSRSRSRQKRRQNWDQHRFARRGRDGSKCRRSRDGSKCRRSRDGNYDSYGRRSRRSRDRSDDSYGRRSRESRRRKESGRKESGSRRIVDKAWRWEKREKRERERMDEQKRQRRKPKYYCPYGSRGESGS